MKANPTYQILLRRGLMAAGLFLAAAWSFAQGQGTGSVEGRVTNPVTGEHLERARITVEGTSLETFSDASGHYRINQVPAGMARLQAFRTGVVTQTHSVNVVPGQTVQQDFSLEPQSAQTTADGTVKLAEFVVSNSREMEGAAIAINTQRFAPNVMNVIAAEEFGPMATGNVGEVLKSVAGVTLTQGGMGEPNTISINGVPPAYVPVTLNGYNFAQASGNTARTIGIHQVSLNNIARIEIAYTPTPETPGSALAGTVNMVPRNAFERSTPIYTASASLLMRDTDLTLGKSPGHRRGPVRKALAGFDFAAIVPVNDRFGFTLTAATSPMYTPLSFLQAAWRGVSDPTNGAAFPHTTPDRPYMTQYSVRDATRITRHTAYAATFDYKLSRNDTLTFTFNYALFDWESNDRQLNFTINRIDGDFGPTASEGVGALLNFNAAQNVNDTLYMPTLTYRHRGPVWKAEIGTGLSHSERLRRDLSDNIFANIIANRANVRIRFDDMNNEGPRRISVWNNANGQPLDPFDLNTYTLLQATGNEIDTTDEQRSLFANISRELPARTPITLKGGIDVRQQIRDIRVDAPVFAATAGRNASELLDESFSQRDGPFWFPPIQWLSNEEAFDLYRSNPSAFGPANEANRHNALTAQSKFARETVSAGFVRGDVHLMEGRLKLVGGLRAEQTNVEGRGDLIDVTRNQRRDANGNLVPVTNDPLEAAKLTHIERGLIAKKEYFRLFPSLNGSFNVRSNLVLRAGYYQSVGRPDFVQYAGSLTLPNTENPPGPNNRINVNNAGIKPWRAETYKMSLEYYFERVGLISIGGFHREFENFFGPSVAQPTPEFLAYYALDAATYGQYDVATQTNLPGKVRMTGLDFNYKQALTFLPHWARGVVVFANFNSQRATGESANEFSGFIPRFGNWGVSLSRPKYTVRLRWNYRARARQDAIAPGNSIAPGTYFWGERRLVTDITAEYQLTKRFSLFANITNLNDAPIDNRVAGPDTPENASFRGRMQFGSLWLFGVRATF